MAQAPSARSLLAVGALPSPGPINLPSAHPMYLHTAHACQDAQWAARIVREQPLASLITTDDAGQPEASHLPMHLQVDAAGHWTLLAHMARANPQWRHLQARPQALVTFLGPNAYLSPAVYPDMERVPSWNYVAVHCRVQARLIAADDAAGKDRLLKTLIAQHEPAYAAQWRGLDANWQQRMLAGIVAFELDVQSWQCAIKLNRHRPESHAALHARYAAGNADEQALAHWMRELGLAGQGS